MNSRLSVAILALVFAVSACLGGKPDGHNQINSGYSGSLGPISFAVYPESQQDNGGLFRGFKDRNCISSDCGFPILAVDNHGKSATFNISGSSGSAYAISKNGKHLLIADFFGIHEINNGIANTIRNVQGTYTERGLVIRDDATYLALMHLGATEIDGEKGFASAVVYDDGKGVKYYKRIIDGNVISCEGKIYLLSYGDENIESRNSVSYKYDIVTNSFVKIRDEGQPSSVRAYSCIPGGGGSFEYIRSQDANNLIGYWDEVVSYNDYTQHPFIDQRSADGSSFFTFKEDAVYLIDYDNVIKRIDKQSVALTTTWKTADVFPELDARIPPVYHVNSDSVVVIGRNAVSKKYLVGKFDLLTGERVYVKMLPLFDEVYQDRDILDIKIRDMVKFDEWVGKQPDYS